MTDSLLTYSHEHHWFWLLGRLTKTVTALKTQSSLLFAKEKQYFAVFCQVYCGSLITWPAMCINLPMLAQCVFSKLIFALPRGIGICNVLENWTSNQALTQNSGSNHNTWHTFFKLRHRHVLRSGLEMNYSEWQFGAKLNLFLDTSIVSHFQQHKLYWKIFRWCMSWGWHFDTSKPKTKCRVKSAVQLKCF